MIIHARRRAGFSLTEALIAIFVMALGLMGVLSLFPLGAVTMAQAIKDDRTAQANHNASTLIRQYWRDHIALQPLPPNNQRPPNFPNPPYPTLLAYQQYLATTYRDPFVDAMLDPNAGFWTAPYALPAAYRSTNPKLSPFSGSRSYPVFLDPVGWNNPNNIAVNPVQRFWVAGDTLGIPRRTLTRIQVGLLNMQSFCMQLDDEAFGKDGIPVDANGNSQTFQNMQTAIQRDGRYSWGYMLVSRPTLRDQADLTIVVYSGRSLDGPSDERLFTGTTFQKGSTEAILPYAGVKPRIRRGSWILDGTMMAPVVVGGNVVGQTPDPHAYFYRVVNVNDDQPGVLVLELQQPAQADTFVVLKGVPVPYGRGVVMDNVSEVFERKILNSVIVPAP